MSYDEYPVIIEYPALGEGGPPTESVGVSALTRSKYCAKQR